MERRPPTGTRSPLSWRFRNKLDELLPGTDLNATPISYGIVEVIAITRQNHLRMRLHGERSSEHRDISSMTHDAQVSIASRVYRGENHREARRRQGFALPLPSLELQVLNHLELVWLCSR
jgi:hypothetical protein